MVFLRGLDHWCSIHDQMPYFILVALAGPDDSLS